MLPICVYECIVYCSGTVVFSERLDEHQSDMHLLSRPLSHLLRNAVHISGTGLANQWKMKSSGQDDQIARRVDGEQIRNGIIPSSRNRIQCA